MEQNSVDLELSNQFDVELYKKHLSIALRAHGEQKTPHGLPYSYHILSVTAEVINAIKEDKLTVEQANIAIGCALLHDVLEDTDYELTEENLNSEIFQGVSALTKDKNLPREEQMSDSLNRLKVLPNYIQMVKIADRITNLDTPPPHWKPEKIKRYLDEAKLIRDRLQSPQQFLWKKLDAKIAYYEMTYLSSEKQ